MNKCLILSFLLIISASRMAGQVKFVEKVEKSGDEIVIPYEKYILPNGLTLILHEDPSDPLVHVDVTYHVGSAREELGKSGFAHFFEHMMFQGSDHVKDEEHFKIITESGGTLNGSTNRDRTNYFETVPANQLETVLWLESDRMGWFLDAVTQEKFEVQRATVKNEKQQNYDNRPYGLYSELSSKTLYPYGHPYSWLTIGILEDLDRVDVNDLKKFFLRWYGPNNATLTIGGDIQPREVIRLVEKYFGEIPAGPEVRDLELEPVVLDRDRYVSYEDSNIRFPALAITFPTVPAYHPDEPALDCLAEIFGVGRNSYLYRRFVETRLAIQSNVSHRTSELAGEFSMFVLPFPGKSLSDFEAEIRKTIAEFENAGVRDEDIQKFKSGYEADAINGLAAVSGKVRRLAAYQTFIGNPDFFREELRRYLAVTKEDVMRVYNRYLKGKASVVVSVLPKGQAVAPSQTDNFTVDPSVTNQFPTTDYRGLTYKKPNSAIDRHLRPKPGMAPLVKVPGFWKYTAANGIRVIGTKNDEIPTTTIQLSFPGGQKLDAKDPSRAGLASLTASMINESTENYQAREIAEELEKTGSTIYAYATQTETIINLQSLNKNLDRTLEILEEKLFRPAFTTEDFERIKKQTIESLQADEKNPASIADLVYNRTIYGEGHIYSVPVDGLTETVENISPGDVKDFYQAYYSPSLCEMVIVGNLNKDEVEKKLDFLFSWPPKKVIIPELPVPAGTDKTKIFLVDKRDAPQSQIRMGYLTRMPYDATGEYFRTFLMNYPLGGAFNSRINLNLREDKGWTYGARSSFNSTTEAGPFTAGAGIKGEATDSAVYEFMKEIILYQEKGITDEELEFMKQSIGQRDALQYEAPGQKARFLSRLLTYNLPENFVDQQNKIIKSITKKEINELAGKHLPYHKMNIIVVGDKAKILDGLSRLKYDIVETDARGNLLTDLQLNKNQ